MLYFLKKTPLSSCPVRGSVSSQPWFMATLTQGSAFNPPLWLAPCRRWQGALMGQRRVCPRCNGFWDSCPHAWEDSEATSPAVFFFKAATCACVCRAGHFVLWLFFEENCIYLILDPDSLIANVNRFFFGSCHTPQKNVTRIVKGVFA